MDSIKIKIILIALIIIITGGVFAWQYFDESKEEIKTPEEKLAEETADWQTYRNEEYGFEMRYPKNWIVTLDFYPSTNVIVIGSEQPGGAGYPAIANEAAVIINPTPDIVSEGREEFKAGGEESSLIFVTDTKIFRNSEKFISTSKCYWSNDPNVQQWEKILNQMLSTFKFEEIEDETASWQTYRNENIGVEVRYPKDWSVREDSFTGEIYFGEKNEIINNEGEEITIEKHGLTIAVYNNINQFLGSTGYSSLEDWFSQITLRDGESKEIIVVGEQNYQGFLLKKYKPIGVVRLYPTTYIQYNNKIYELTGNIPTISDAGFETSYDYDETYYQILSTFKFLK